MLFSNIHYLNKAVIFCSKSSFSTFHFFNYTITQQFAMKGTVTNTLIV